MDCSEFERRLGLEIGPEAERALCAHAARCDGCARKLRLRDLISSGLGELPRVPVPAGVDDSLRGAAYQVVGSSRWSATDLLRIAAVLALLVAGGLALAFLAPGSRPRRQKLRVVVEAGNGFVDEDSVLEEIYGPDATPLLTALEDPRRGR